MLELGSCTQEQGTVVLSALALLTLIASFKNRTPKLGVLF